MPAINLANGDYKRTLGRTPRLRHVNVIVEPDPANPVTGVTIMGRAGLTAETNLGTGPINLLWQQDGTFLGDFIVQSGTTVYLRNVVLGDIADGYSRAASRGTDAIIVDDAGSAWITGGTDLVKIEMPDGQLVQDVASINSYYLLVVKGSQRIYFIEPGLSTVDPLDFFAAERTPDNVEAVAILGDEVWFLGTAGTEVWTPSGDADAPFQRTSGRVYSYGCRSKMTVVVLDEALFWVTQDNQVVRAQGTPSPIDNPAVSEQLRGSSNFRAYCFRQDDHSFYVLTGVDLTLVFDTLSTLWSHWHSYARQDWIPHMGAQNGARILVGASDSGKLWVVTPEATNDAGAVITREVTGFVANIGNPVSCNSMTVHVAAGWSPSPDFEPKIEVCWSDDNGNIWSPWWQIGLGTQGRYDTDTILRSLGQIVRPGRLFWYRMTDDALFRLSYARVNDA